MCDCVSQSEKLGELHHAIIQNKTPDFVLELGNIIADPSLGRKDPNDITVCDLTGTGAQDTAIAVYAIEKALKKNFGMELSS